MKAMSLRKVAEKAPPDSADLKTYDFTSPKFKHHSLKRLREWK
jgi:hypothetical protein